ncbi:hypothetical protein C414_000020064 [Campylobacter jejuni subsp. jejuni 414]|nr:hypothetical protein C414_000020064 [Campylobacter jejuni subsp. jejuni 414]
MSETLICLELCLIREYRNCCIYKKDLNKALEIAFETIEKNHVNIEYCFKKLIIKFWHMIMA